MLFEKYFIRKYLISDYFFGVEVRIVSSFAGENSTRI